MTHVREIPWKHSTDGLLKCNFDAAYITRKQTILNDHIHQKVFGKGLSRQILMNMFLRKFTTTVFSTFTVIDLFIWDPSGITHHNLFGNFSSRIHWKKIPLEIRQEYLKIYKKTSKFQNIFNVIIYLK